MNIIKVERKKFTLLAEVDRPAARNAINFEAMGALEELIGDIEEDDSIRALVLRGAGDEVFISGGDLREFHTIKSAEDAGRMARRMLDILKRIERLPCWSIACINGPAYGGGCEMMLAFDFRIAAAEATFNFTQGKFYLPPGWGGLTRLIERVGRSTALKWLAEAATIDSEAALCHRLVDRCHPAEELTQAVLDFAGRITKNDRKFIQNLKRRALPFSESRTRAIEDELGPFTEFWESERHEQRVERFLKRNENSE